MILMIILRVHHNVFNIYEHFSNKITGAVTTGKGDRVGRIQSEGKKELQEKE